MSAQSAKRTTRAGTKWILPLLILLLLLPTSCFLLFPEDPAGPDDPAPQPQPQPNPPVEPTSKIAELLLNGNAIDSSGGGFSGALTGTTPTINRHGASGTALQFDGIDDRIQVAENVIPTPPFSVSVWFKTANPSHGQALFGNYVGLSYDGRGLHANLWNNGAYPEQIELRHGHIHREIQFYDDEWHHIVAVVDPAWQMLYVDGVLQGTQTSYTYLETNEPFYIGALDSTVGLFQFFDGALDDLRIYGELLTDANVAWLYAE